MIFLRAFKLASPYPERRVIHLYTNGFVGHIEAGNYWYIFEGVAPATSVPDSREVARKYRPLIRALQSIFDTTEDLTIYINLHTVAAWNDRFLVVVYRPINNSKRTPVVVVYNKVTNEFIKTSDEFQMKLALSVVLARIDELLKLVNVKSPADLAKFAPRSERDEVKMALAPGAILYVHPSVKSVASTSYPSDP